MSSGPPVAVHEADGADPVEDYLREGDYAEAVDHLCREWRGRPDPVLRSRIEGKYLDVVSQGIAASLGKVASANGGTATVAVLDFTTVAGNASLEGVEFAGGIKEAMLSRGAFTVVDRDRIDKVIEEIEFGNTSYTASSQRKAGTLLNADYLVSGTLGRTVRCEMTDVATGALAATVSFSRPGWEGRDNMSVLRDKVTHLRSVQNPFGLRIWTDRSDYRIGDDIVYNVSVESPCHLRLLSLDPDGTLVQVFPNPYARGGYVARPRTLRLGASDGGYALTLTPPAGEHHVVAIATGRPLASLNFKPKAGIFASFANPEEGGQLMREVEKELDKLDVAQYSLAITVIHSKNR